MQENESKFRCSIHRIQKKYFCFDCKDFFCSDCLIYSKSHEQNHLVFKGQYQERKVISELIEEKKKIENFIEKVENECINLTKKKLEEINETMEKEVQHFQTLIKIVSNSYEKQKKYLIEQQNFFNDFVKKLENNSQEISKLIKNYNDSFEKEYEKKIRKVLLNNKSTLEYFDKNLKFKDFIFKPITLDIAPSKFSFEIDFNCLIKSKGKFLTSKTYGNQLNFWTIDVCVSKDKEFKGVGLYLTLMPCKATKNNNFLTDFYIELVNFSQNQNLLSVRERKLFNHKDNSFGYRDFCSLDLIRKGGFVNENGKIFVNFYVKPINIETFLLSIEEKN